MSRITLANGLSLSRGHSRVGFMARIGDYVELTKPRIVLLELVTIVVAAHLASPWGIPPAVLLHTVFGAALVAARITPPKKLPSRKATEPQMRILG